MTRQKSGGYDFKAAVSRGLANMGAQFFPHYSTLVNAFELQTTAGSLRCSVDDDTLNTRFYDVDAAKKAGLSGRLNPFSGKWNWVFSNPTEQDVLDLFLQHLLPLKLPGQRAHEMLQAYLASIAAREPRTPVTATVMRPADAIVLQAVSAGGVRRSIVFPQAKWYSQTYRVILNSLAEDEAGLSFIPCAVGLAWADAEERHEVSAFRVMEAAEVSPEWDQVQIADFAHRIVLAGVLQGWEQPDVERDQARERSRCG